MLCIPSVFTNFHTPNDLQTRSKNVSMKKYIFISVLLVLLSCQSSVKNTESAADKAFDQLAREFVQWYLDVSPQSAVSLGLHAYDGKLGKVSQAAIDAEFAQLKKFDAKLSEIDTAALSTQKYYDWRILRSNIKVSIFWMDDLHIYRSNPMVYAGAIDVNIYVKRNFAPIEQQVQSIISIEKDAPAFFEHAKQNLQDTLV